MDPAAAAQKWIDANPDKVKAWLGLVIKYDLGQAHDVPAPFT